MNTNEILKWLAENYVKDKAKCTERHNWFFYGNNLRIAFQPIVDVVNHTVFAYEALVRGANGESAEQVLSSISYNELYSFDQVCRVLAINTANRLRISTQLSINFFPNAIYEPVACLRFTLLAAEKVGFPNNSLIFELTEVEQIRNLKHVLSIVQKYQQCGFWTAIDDFGTGYSGLNLLAEYQPQLIKIDMKLIRGIDQNRIRQAIIKGIINTCEALGISVVAEGVETQAEYEKLRYMGIRLFQGYLFARPAIEALPEPNWSVIE